MTFDRWKDKLKETTEHAKQLSHEAATKAADLSQGAGVKARELSSQLMIEGKIKLQQALDATLKEIENLRPILKQAGFVIGDINVSITVPPHVMVTIKKFEECAEQLNSILADPLSELNDTQRTVLSLLAKANTVSEVTSKYGYIFSEFDLTMSIPPQLTVHLITKRALT